MAAGFFVTVLLVFLAWQRSDLESPDATYLLRDRHGEFLGEAGEHRNNAEDEEADGYGYWPLEEIPPRVAAAALAVEDRHWARHPGVDAVAVVRALWQNVREGERVSGASTIAMQVARLQRPGPRTYPRKALEALTALWLTARHGREAVLRHYLRLVPYGHRIHGIAYAARRYLDKPVRDLSWAEVAFLAAIPQAPSRMSPFDPRGRGRAVRRGLRILELLRRDGVISAEEWRVAERQIARLRIPPREARPEEALHAILRLEDELARGSRDAPRLVRTTLDLELQREVAWETGRLLEGWRRKGAGNAAVLVLERQDSGQASGAEGAWKVRAAVGSARWGDEEHAGAIDYLRVPRSSGSTLKPFFYAQALDRGLIRPTTVLDDLGRGAGGIVNADGRFLGPLLPRFALGNSRNVPAAGLLARIGVGEGWLFLADLGLHEGRPGEDGGPERLGLGLTLGSLAVTVEDLARAYTALASDGLLHEPRWIAGETAERPRRLISEETARRVALYLSDPQARLPSFPRMGHLEYAWPVAVKTGTSSRRRDAWAVAFTRRHLVVAWVGHPDHRPMHGLTGYTSAAYLVRRVMDRLHRLDGSRANRDRERGLADVGFPPPRGHEAVKVCALSGRRAGPACDRLTVEWLEPQDARALAPCPHHRHIAVDGRTGVLADHRTPREEIEIRAVAAGLPPRYARWARDAGLPQMPPTAGRVEGPLHAVLGAASLATVAEPREATVRIVSPRDGELLLVDPETPPGLSTVELRAVVDPPDRQILWTVDGEPYALAGSLETTRWPLEPGEHVFRAEVPSESVRSAGVRVRVE